MPERVPLAAAWRCQVGVENLQLPVLFPFFTIKSGFATTSAFAVFWYFSNFKMNFGHFLPY